MKNITLSQIGKRVLFILAIAMVFSFSADAQRIAYVDVNRLLETMPEYQKSQKELDQTAAKWRQDIAQEYDVIKGMYNKYQAEQVLMSDDMRTQKEEEIMNAEKRVREMQKQKFGPEGALFKKRQDLVRPIQEKVYTTIEDYANEKGYDFIFDKSASSGMIFSNARYDKTDDLLQKLGLK